LAASITGSRAGEARRVNWRTSGSSSTRSTRSPAPPPKSVGGCGAWVLGALAQREVDLERRPEPGSL